MAPRGCMLPRMARLFCKQTVVGSIPTVSTNKNIKEMSASLEELKLWFRAGVKNGKEFMIVVTDTFSHSNHPVYSSEEYFAEEYRKHNGKNMQVIEEVYNLKMDEESQMKQRRARNYPKNFNAVC